MPTGFYGSEETKNKLRPLAKRRKYTFETRMKMSKSHMGRIPWIKGKHHSEETKLKIKLGNKNKIVPDDVRKRISEALKGHSVSQETIEKIRLAGLGRQHTEEFKKKMSLRLLGNKYSAGRHFRHTEETKMKISQSHFGIRPGEETRAKFRAHRLRQVLPTKDTLIELALQNKLQESGIKFEKHKPIVGQPDIFIEPNIAIFCDGCYWHACPKCSSGKPPDRIQSRNLANDEAVTTELTSRGYTVLRFWGHDITNDIESCLNAVKRRLEREIVINRLLQL